MAQGTDSPWSAGVFLASALLPLSFALAAAQSVMVARRGQREAWALAAFHVVVAAVLATRWVWELGAPSFDGPAALSLSYAGLQSAAFGPALWLPQLVHLPWLARAERPRSGAAAFAWWLGVTFSGLAALMTLAGAPGAYLSLGSWHAEASAPRAPGQPDTLWLATRLPPALDGDDAAWRRVDMSLTALEPRATALVVRADDLLRAQPFAHTADARVEREHADGRPLLVVLIGPGAWYETGVPPDTAARHTALARAAAEAARRWRPAWLFPVGDAGLLTRLCVPAGRDSSRAGAAIAGLAAVADSVRATGAPTRLGLAGFEPWAGTPGADAWAGARDTLYDWVARPGTPFEVVGLVLHAGFEDRRAFDARLHAAERMLARLPPGKRAWVIEFAGSPGVSGERHQAEHLRAVVAWGRAQEQLEGVAQTALVDGPERAGLVSWLGRRRAAFTAYREALAAGP